MANYYNQFGSQTLTGTAGADAYYLYNKSTSPGDVRVDAFYVNFSWTSQLTLAGGVAYVLTGTNVNTSMDTVIGDKYDAIYGSSGNDFLAYNNGTFGDGVGGFQNIQLAYLGAGDDIVDLTAHGAGGAAYGKNMKIYAGDGNDQILGGAGSDIFYGDDGNDLIIGFAGGDTIYGGLGDDTIYGDDLGYDGSRSYDKLYGNEGNDVLYGGGRDDVLDGGADDDVLYGGWGGDTLLGQQGNDIIWGDDLDGTGTGDKIDGGAGDDQLHGVDGNDLMLGGWGADLLDGGTGNDSMFGDGDNDTILAGAGDDQIDGGDGIDTVVFTGNRTDYLLQSNPDGSVTLTDMRGGAPDGIDRIINAEWFQFADQLVDATHLSTPPTITSNGGGAVGNANFTENETGAITTVTATDPDQGQTLTYRILGGVDQAFFAIDGATGVLTFVDPPDFENKADNNHDGIYYVVVGADDGAGGIGLQTLRITVLDVPDGNAPIFVGGLGRAVGVNENLQAVTTVHADDPDGTGVSYHIVGGSDASLFAVDAATGEVVFLAAPDYENPADSDGNNVFEVIISATDGVNSAWQTLSVTLGNTNDSAPVVTSFNGNAVVTINRDENSTAVGTVTASDPDGSVLTYSITGGADASFFTVNAATGELSFKTGPDYENPQDANGDNRYRVIVTVSDGVAAATQEFNVGVRNLNDTAPVITSNGGGASAAIIVNENSLAVATVAASDADGSSLTYSIAGGADAGFFTIDAQTGALTFGSSPDFERPLDAGGDNVYNVIVAVSDGVAQDQQALAVTISDVSEIGVTLTGSGASETFSPTAATLAYRTTALDDTIFAKGGNDTIDGGAGADYMAGAFGNDTYYVDTWSDNGWAADDDQVVEAAGAGTDTVYASVSYRLTDNVEILRLQGSGALSGWGNDLSNTLVGAAGNNLLDGGAGNDTINGNGGDDTLYGGDGTDILNGGAGADTMAGGVGNDAYYVDSWSDDGNAANDDIVVELAGGGIDTVTATVTYTLTDEVEKLILGGTAAIDGTGNALANAITGNNANNKLYGGDGDDSISAEDGDDQLDGGEGNDTLVGGAGIDKLNGGNGLDTLDGGEGDDALIGGLSNDVLFGQAGNDTLNGGKGRDQMTGGAGADTFVFKFADTSKNNGFQDFIRDFVSGVDTLSIDVLAAAPASYVETTVASSAYADGLAAADALALGGATVVFVAGSTDGWLYWDGNGDGVLDQAIILTGANTLDAFAATDII